MLFIYKDKNVILLILEIWKCIIIYTILNGYFSYVYCFKNINIVNRIYLKNNNKNLLIVFYDIIPIYFLLNYSKSFTILNLI